MYGKMSMDGIARSILILDPNHYYCHETYQKVNLSAVFPAEMKTENTNWIAFALWANHIMSIHSSYQHNNNNLLN